MAKGLGRMDRGFGLGSVKRSLSPKAAGLYPTKGKGLGEYGSVKFPSILEAYNRDSDFKRWKLGMDYYFGSGRTWGDYQILSCLLYTSPSPRDLSTSRMPSSA